MESEFHRELWKMLGADPISTRWPDVVTAMKQKSIDEQENPLSVIRSYKFYKTQKYLSLTRHVYSPNLNVANLEWFNSFSEADKKLIRQCMQEAASYQNQWNRTNMAFFSDQSQEEQHGR